jgi:hypothetical protein
MELKVEKANALLAYRNADKVVKKALEDLLGANTFRVITEQSEKAFQQACEKLNIKPEDVLPFPNAVSERQIRANAREMLDVLAEAVKLGLPALDYSDKSQYKYYPWLDWKVGVGFVVVDSGCVHTHAGTDVGSRLSFHDSKTAIAFAQEHIDLYNIAFI